MAVTFKATGSWVFSANNVQNPSNLSPVAPAARAVGDLLVLVTTSRSITATVATPTGWTLVPGFPKRSATASGGTIYVFVRIADNTATDNPSISWSGVATGTSGDSCAAATLCWSGADITFDGTPPDATDTVGTGAVNIPDYTVANNGSLVIGVAMKVQDAAQTWTVANYTERSDSGGTTSGTGHTTVVAEEIMPAAGSTGTAACTPSSATSGRLLAASFAVNVGQVIINASDTVTLSDNASAIAVVTPPTEVMVDDFNRADGYLESGAGASLWRSVNHRGSYGNLTKLASNAIANSYNNETDSLFILDRDFDFLIDHSVVDADNKSDIQLNFCGVNFYPPSPENYSYIRIYMPDGSGYQTLMSYGNDGGTTNIVTKSNNASFVAGETIWVSKRGTTIIVYRKLPGSVFIEWFRGTIPAAYDRPGIFTIRVPGGSSLDGGRWDNLRATPLLSIPVATLRDNFNRANVYPVDGNWTGQFGGGGWQIVSNQIVNLKGAGQWDALVYVPTPDADQMTQVTLAGIGAVGSALQLWCRRDHAVDTGYFVNVIPGSTLDDAYITKRIATVDTTLLSCVGFGKLAAGDKLALQVVGNKIRLWHYDALVAAGPAPALSAWNFVGEAIDTAITDPGQLALYSNDPGWILDDFSSGGSALTLSVSDSVTLSDSLTTDWTPLLIPNCQIWLDASIRNIGSMSSWPNLAPSGVALTYVSPGPVIQADEFGINGRRVARFSSTGGGFYTNASGIQKEFTIFVVARMYGAQRERIIGGAYESGVTSNFLIGWWGNRMDLAYMEGWLDGNSTGVPVTTAVKLYTADGTAGFSGRLFSDGVQIRGPSGGTDGPKGTFALNQLLATERSDADVGEVIAYNRRLTDAERQQVEAYLRAKWLTPGAALTLTVADSVTATDDGGSFVQDFGLSAADTITTSESAVWDWTIAPVDAVTTSDALGWDLSPIDASDSVTLSDELTLADFTPAVIPNCTHWFDADDDASFVYGTGRAVKEWHDKSGTDEFVSQATAAAQPTRTMPEFGRNGRPVVQFDGGDYLQRAASVLSASGFTVVMVCVETTHRNYAGIFAAYNTGNPQDHDNGNSFAIDTSASPNQLYLERGSVTGAVISGANPTPLAVYAGIGRPDKTQQVYKNGTPGGSATTAVALGSANSLLLGGRWLASAVDVANYGLIGQIAEICVYDRVLNDAERQQVEAYLTQKWLTAGTAYTLNVADNVTVDDSSTFDQAHTLSAADSVTTSESLQRDQDFVLSPTDAVTTSDAFAYAFEHGINPVDSVVLTDNDTWAQTFELFIIESDSVTVTDLDDLRFAYNSTFADSVVLTDLITDLTVGLFFSSAVVLSDAVTWKQESPQVVVTVI